MYGVDVHQRLIPGATVDITGEEARHAAQVARLRVGERVSVSDGQGAVAVVEAIAVGPGSISAVVLSVTHHPEPVPAMWLIQALAKGGRGEQAIEQAVELGVSRVIPWAAKRSVSVWRGEKKDTGQARWARIVREAAKQSLQPWWPVVDPLHTTADVAGLADEVSLIVLDPDAPDLLTDLVTTLPSDRPLALVVGPEGGIGEDEWDIFREAGSQRGRLGPTVLRTSSAGPVAIAVTMSARGMWASGGNPRRGFVE
jgi:16S rRNA (uracil1498-N3)-methyltransferase